MGVSDEAMRELAALSGVVLGQADLPGTLVEVCRIATRAVPGAEGASVTTFPQGRPAAVSSDEWAQTLDELQFVEHEGPCLDAYRTGNLFRVRDLSGESRWPSYVPRAFAAGARSMVSLPMAAQGSIIGALNLYSRTRDAFDAGAVSIAEVVAAHAGMASEVSAAFFGHRELAEQLKEAMRSRAVIEQAKGILMARLHLDDEAAFQHLVQQSRTSNTKLRDVAAQVVREVARVEA